MSQSSYSNQITFRFISEEKRKKRNICINSCIYLLLKRSWWTVFYSMLVWNVLQSHCGSFFPFFLFFFLSLLSAEWQSHKWMSLCTKKKKTWKIFSMTSTTNATANWSPADTVRIYEWKHIATTTAEWFIQCMNWWQKCGTLSIQQCNLDARFRESLAFSGESRRENARALSLKSFFSNCQ